MKGLKCRLQIKEKKKMCLLCEKVTNRNSFLPSLSPVTDHELCGSVGGPGVRAGQGAIQGTQPCNTVWMYRCYRGTTARWHPAVLINCFYSKCCFMSTPDESINLGYCVDWKVWAQAIFPLIKQLKILWIFSTSSTIVINVTPWLLDRAKQI